MASTAGTTLPALRRRGRREAVGTATGARAGPCPVAAAEAQAGWSRGTGYHHNDPSEGQEGDQRHGEPAGPR
jgi:hypothetical protein